MYVHVAFLAVFQHGVVLTESLLLSFSVMHVSVVRHDWQLLMRRKWRKNMNVDKKIKKTKWITNKNWTLTHENTHYTFFNIHSAYNFSHTFAFWNKLAVFNVMYVFYAVLSFLLLSINGCWLGLFLNGLPAQDYRMLGLDVALHSRLRMRL